MMVHFFDSAIAGGGHKAVCGKVYRPGMHVNGRFFKVTKDPAGVTCKKCAAALGFSIASVAKEKEELHRTGTCQCCFGTFKVSKANGTKISLHGYRRHNWGYAVGRCVGEGHLPFEVSCEETQKLLASVQGFLAEKEAELAGLKNNPPEPSSVLLRRRISDLERHIEAAKAQVAFLSEKVASWKKVW